MTALHELDGDPLLERLEGVLLGTALGDALGLPAEGMAAHTIARRFGRVDRFRLLGRTGYVSDDTEQSALVALCLAAHPADAAACAAAFRTALARWFLTLPWGIGGATLRACLRILSGRRESGVPSAGNGAAMRAAPVGVFFYDRPDERRSFGEALARVTHTDARAVQGARYVAEVAAACAGGDARSDRAALCRLALSVVEHPGLKESLERAMTLADARMASLEAARQIGTTGYTLHSVPFAVYCFIRYAEDPLAALCEAIGAGGDTDSNAAILGAWSGALHGAGGLPDHLLSRIHGGPCGPTHLRALAQSLATIRAGRAAAVPAQPVSAALVRNLALWPVILAHAARRLLP